jgi:acid phosphatase type 7
MLVRRSFALLATTGLIVSGVILSPRPAYAVAAADPVIAAAGDIACDPADSAFHAGNGTSTRCHEKYTGNQLATGGFAGVLALGDEQYECGGASAFSQSYSPTWGVPAVKAITHPAPGNHEYDTSGGTDCGNGANGYFGYYGSAAGDPGKGYYSFDIGTWHLISLNSNCTFVSCSAGSTQEKWLAQDLAAHSNACTVAYWHHPAFSAGPSTNGSVRPFWNDLYAAHADLVLNGHKHNYQRLTKLSPSGSIDQTNGIREFVVGTGGRDHGLSTSLYPGTEASDGKHFGILELTLHPTSYGWQFVADTGAVLDSGSSTCNTAGASVNTPPTSQVLPTQTTDKNTPASIPLTATDPETCELTFTIVTQPAHASTLSPSTAPCTPGDPNSDTSSVTYTPVTNFTGSDSFRWKVTDEAGADSSIVTVDVVVGTNAAPTADASSGTTDEDSANQLTLVGHDAETCELAFIVPATTTHGSLGGLTNQPCTGTGPFTDTATVTYTPASNYNGPDSFSFQVNDSAQNSVAALVSITINPLNDAPTADALTSSTAPDTPTSVQLRGHDAESCDLAFSVVDPPVSGSLGLISDDPCAPGNPNLDTASVTYTPAGSFVGQDTFTYTVTDSDLLTSTKATVTVTVAQQGISLRGASSAVNPTATSLVLPAPAGVQAGDVMIAQVDVRGGPTITPPAGWSTIRVDSNPTQMKAAAYYRVATASEPSSYTWTFSTSQAASGGIAAYVGVNTSTPIDTSSSAQATTGTTSITAPSVTTAGIGEMIVGLYTSTGVGTVTPPAGTSERWDVNSTAGSYKIISEVADFVKTTAGPTGDKIATATVSGRNIGQLIALMPAS